MDGILITTVIVYMEVEIKNLTKFVYISISAVIIPKPKNILIDSRCILGDEIHTFKKIHQKDYAQNY